MVVPCFNLSAFVELNSPMCGVFDLILFYFVGKSIVCSDFDMSFECEKCKLS